MTEREVLSLIKSWQSGEQQASRVLMELAYIKIKEYATANYQNLPDDVNTQFMSYSATDLAHDTYEKVLAAESSLPLETMRQFYAYLNAAVRNLFVDSYRKHVKARSRNPEKVSIHSSEARAIEQSESDSQYTLLAVENLIAKLEVTHHRQAEVMQLRYFSQKSNKEIARLMDVSLRTVENDLRFTKAYLKSQLV